MLSRHADITPLVGKTYTIEVDGAQVEAAEGETVLSAVMAIGKKQVMCNDHTETCGAYCGMGICHCCHVTVDGKYKQRACRTLVQDGMQIKTQSNRFKDVGIR